MLLQRFQPVGNFILRIFYMKKYELTVDDESILIDTEEITDWQLRTIFIAVKSELAYRKSVLNGEYDKEMMGHE